MIRKNLATHKKVIDVFCFNGTRAQWDKYILKIMFKFTFFQMAETNANMCVNNFKSEASLVPKVLFTVGRIKSKSAFQNTEYREACQIEITSSFHSLIV